MKWNGSNRALLPGLQGSLNGMMETSGQGQVLSQCYYFHLLREDFLRAGTRSWGADGHALAQKDLLRQTGGWVAWDAEAWRGPSTLSGWVGAAGHLFSVVG